MMESGTSSALTIGDAAVQTSVPVSNTNFNGNFAFLSSGNGTSGPITRIGRFTADGNGGLGSVFADTNDAGLVEQVPHGSISATTYAIDTNFPGTGRGTFTFTDSKLGTYQFVMYLSSSSGGVIQEISKNGVTEAALNCKPARPSPTSAWLVSTEYFSPGSAAIVRLKLPPKRITSATLRSAAAIRTTSPALWTSPNSVRIRACSQTS
jgi:hypothetical protein